jgi:hypothetical protein
MAIIRFDPANSKSIQTRVPAREVVTPEELTVIVKWNQPSTKKNVPAGTVVFQTKSYTGEATLFFQAPGRLSMSCGKDWLTATVPLDLQSAILDRAEEIYARKSEIVVGELGFGDFATATGAVKGYLSVPLGDEGNVYSMKYGVGRNGEAFLLPAQIFKKSENKDDDIVIDGSGKQYLSGNYTVETVDGVTIAHKNDVRAGGVFLNPDLATYLLECTKQHCIQKGWIYDNSAMATTLNAREREITEDMVTPEGVSVSL